MKTLSELSHYELLEIGRDAGPEEIERAYRMATITYEEGSLATYSLLDDSEATAMRERIEHAYAVLSDNEARDVYDRSHGGDAAPEEAQTPPIEFDLAFEDPVPARSVLGEVAEFEEALEEDDAPYDGARLRRNRLQRGVEIEQIALVTKINPTYLRFIEEERFDDLPATVYVRGFVNAYARCLGLDPSRVVPEYIERFEASSAIERGGRG